MAGPLRGELARATAQDSPPFLCRTTWHAALAGRSAMGALHPGTYGSVIAVFRHSFYAETVRGEILCVASPTLQPGPLNLVCNFTDKIDLRVPGLRQGVITKCSDDALNIGDLWSIGLGAARIWKPQAIRHPVKAEVLAHGLEVLRRLRREFGGNAADGGQLIQARHAFRSRAALRRASDRPVASLREWLALSLAQGAAAKPPPESVLGLLGLGPGLTPSGDDFLGGVMLALMALGYRFLAKPIEALVLAAVRGRTNAISAAHLRSAAKGEGSAPIHGLLSAVCGQSSRSIGSWVREVDQIGHTSGWDTVAGMEIVLSAVLANASKRRSLDVGYFPV